MVKYMPNKTVSLPDFTKPLDIKVFMRQKLGACSCSELDEMITVVVNFLAWVNVYHTSGSDYTDLFDGDVGVYYLIAGQMLSAGLIEHGTSIRVPWLTEQGKSLLDNLQKIDADVVDNAVGVAYDGDEYVEYA